MTEKKETAEAEAPAEAKTKTPPKAKAKPIAALVGEVSLELGKLVKTEKNAFQKYKYVPIDAYYEIVAAAAIKAGLTWRTTCVDWRPVGNGHMAFDFEFDLISTSTGEVWEGWSRIPIIHPVQGAQTAGSAMSYAEKLMMRSTFKVVTGEDDADATDQRKTKKAQASKPKEEKPAAAADTKENKPDKPDEDTPLDGEVIPPGEPDDAPPKGTGDLSPEEWETVYAAMLPFISKKESVDELNSYWRDNKAVLSNMKEQASDKFEDLLTKFKAHKSTLEGAV